jgi:hypothetical protein
MKGFPAAGEFLLPVKDTENLVGVFAVEVSELAVVILIRSTSTGLSRGNAPLPLAPFLGCLSR